MLKLVLSVVLLGLVGQCFAQTRFLVNVAEQTSTTDLRFTIRCIGTIISPNLVLVPASCVTSPSPAIFTIRIPTEAVSGTGDPLYETIAIERIIPHPDYERGQDRINNIAFVVVSWKLFDSMLDTPYLVTRYFSLL